MEKPLGRGMADIRLWIWDGVFRPAPTRGQGGPALRRSQEVDVTEYQTYLRNCGLTPSNLWM